MQELETIALYMVFALIIFWSVLWFEWSKFKKNPEGYWKTMIELKKIKRSKK